MARRLKCVLVLALTTMVALGILYGTASADGFCGENVTWSFSTKSGELSISGTGAMTDYSPDSTKWKNINTSNVKTIVIHEGVTHIGTWAFPDFTNLTSVTIADSVISIGNYAFYGCGQLRTVNIPNHVETIGNYVFGSCYGLNSITIPNSVNNIGTGVFLNCGMLNSVTYNGSRTEWEKITIGANNAPLMGDSVTFLMADGGTCGKDVRWSLSNDGELVISGTGPMSNYTANNPAPWQCSAESIVSISFEDGVTNVGNRAFYNCSALTEVSFGNTVSNIGNEAFYNCQSLNAPDLPSSLKTIGSNAFAYCNGFTETIVIPEGVTSIYSGAFANCSNLEGVTMPSTLTELYFSAFNNCSSMTSLILPAEMDQTSYIEIDSYPEGLTVYAYRNSAAAYILGRMRCDFKVPGSNYYLRYDFGTNWTYDDLPIDTVLTAVDKDVTTFTIPDDVTQIGYRAFYECSLLESIQIPNHVTSIGYEAFKGCNSLASIFIPNNTTVSEETFDTSARIYANMNTAAARSLGRAGYSFTVPETTYQLQYQFTNNTESGLILTGIDAGTTTLHIPEGVTGYSEGVFASCTTLKEVHFPETITSIANGSFRNCSGIEKVVLSDTMTEIGDYTFYGCSNLSRINLPDVLTTIGQYAFEGCNSLESIEIPDSLTSIGTSALGGGFADISMIRYISGNAAIRELLSRSNYTFRIRGNNYDLRDQYYFNTYEGTYLYNVDKNVTSFTIPGGVTGIGQYAFAGCTELENIVIPAGVSLTEIGLGAFSGCSSLESFDWPSGVSTIPGDVFKDSTSLETINIGNQVSTIRSGAFSNCSALASITFGNYVTNVESGAFSNCHAVRYASTESYTAQALGKAGYSFRTEGANYDLQYDYITYPTTKLFATELRNVDKDVVSFTIPDAVTVIGEKAFENCSSLSGLEIPDKITYINSEAFKNCSNLTGVVILWGSTQIAEDAFANVNGVTLYGHANSSAQTFATARGIPFVEILGTHALTETPGVDATCLTQGQETYWTCLICGKMFSDAEGTNEIAEPVVITDGAHTLSKHEGEEADCTSTGTEAYWECTTCGKLFSDEEGKNPIEAPVVIPAGHIEVIDEGFAATCTEPGKTDGKHCSRCNEVLVAQEEISAGHQISHHERIDATFTQDGTEEYWECTRCGLLFSDADGEHEIDSPVVILQIIGQGTSGENLFWKVDREGTLTISGTGAMTADPAWLQVQTNEIKKVIIQDGVTTIGYGAFSNLGNLVSVSIPDSVTSIGDYAFSNCGELTGVLLSEKVTNIGNSAFSGCSSLESFDWPAGVATIPGDVFKDCTSLRTFNVGNQVRTIQAGAFSNCNALAAITFGDDVTNIESGAFSNCGAIRYARADSTTAESLGIAGYSFRVEGANYDLQYDYITDPEKERVATELRNVDKDIVTFVIPDVVTVIGEKAFESCNALGGLEIPSRITSVNSEAFKDCAKLTGVLILGDSTLIAEDVFANVNGVTLYGHANSDAQTFATAREIPFAVIQGTHALTETPRIDATCLTPGQEAYWTCVVCGKMFGDAEGTSEITEPIAIPDGAHTLEQHERVEPTTTTDGTEEYWECCVCHLLFSDANGQTVITEPKIIPLAIALKSSCSEATWYHGLQGYNPERNGLYSYTCMGLFSIPESVWDENDRAVDWSLTCTNGPDNFQLDYDPNSSEQKDIFTASLKPKGGTMTTGDSVYSVRALYKGVYYCGTIMTHTVDNGLPTGMTIRIFETDATGATIGSEVSVTNGNATLESGKYYYLTGCFDGINVDIGRQWMNYGAVSKGIVFRGSRWQGDDYSISQWYRICYTNSNRFMTGQTGDYSCEAVLSLGTASNLASRMPLTFTVEPAIIDSGTCGTSAEWTLNSDGLLSITGSGAIETSAFNNRQGVKKIIISEGITEIGNNTFALCYDLEEVQLPDGFGIIGNYAFAQCTKLENINIPGSITVIGTQSFSSCTALVSVDIPYETDVSPDAFAGCSNLTVYGYASSSAEKAANENSFIAYKSGTWGENVAWSLNDDNELAITGTGEIKNGHPWGTDVRFVTIEEGITAIGSENFLDCVSLTSVTLPDSVTIIQNGAFNGCISLKSVLIPVSVTKIEAAAFGGCEAFTDVYYGGLLSQWSGIEIESTDNDRLLSALIHCNHLLSRQAVTEATCTGEGTEEYWVCIGCGKMFSDETGETEIEAPIPIPAEGHSFTAYARKEATCTEPGHIAYWDCSRCHKLFSDAEGMNEISDTTIDALGHEEVIDEAEEPTCTEDGRTEGKHCGRCNEVLEERKVIPANGHTEVIDPAVAPTSTEPGLTEGKHCSVCKAILVPQEEIPPTGDPNKFAYISDGNPEGDEEEIQFTCFDQICEEGIHSYTRQQLDNGNTRFTLQFTMPAGLHISVFDPPDGNTFKYVDLERVTSAEQSILQFDLTDDELDNIGEITVMFFNDEINTGVHVNLDSIVPDPKPAEKDYITFGLTDGTPAEEEADRLPYYFSRFDGAQGMTGTLQNAVRHRLNNGKSRITIQYSVPAGLRVLVVARPNATELYDSNAYNIVTASGRSVLQFDIPDSTYDTFSAIQVLFQKPNCNVFGLLVYPHADTADPEQATIVMNRTDGIPVGDETDVRIVSRGNWSGTVYGGRMQKLNNGYFRFTLRFSVPDGSFARVAGRAFDYYCATVGTSSIHDTLQVDIPSDGLQGWDYFTVQFTYLDEANSFSVDADVYYYDLDTMNVLYLPDGLNTIEAEAFEGLACEAVVVPAGCESIGDGAFRNCKELKYIRIPAGAEMGKDVFEGCGDVVIERVGNE